MLDATDNEYLENSNLKFKSTIGCGGYGVVYLVFSEQYNELFALKKVPVNKFRSSEILCMEKLNHPNIIKVFKCEKHGNFVYQMLEYCPHTLMEYLKTDELLSSEHVLKYSKEILLGLCECHKKRIAHQDIKPSNILIDCHGRVKITDFGFSQEFNSRNELTDKYCGTYYFLAPEVLANTPHDPFKADVWSIGVTFFNIVTGTFPWPTNDRKTYLRAIIMGTPQLEVIKNVEYRRIIQKCLKYQPKDRPTIEELLLSPIFEEKNSDKSIKAVPRSNAMSASANLRRSLKLSFKLTPKKMRCLGKDTKLAPASFAGNV